MPLNDKPIGEFPLAPGAGKGMVDLEIGVPYYIADPELVFLDFEVTFTQPTRQAPPGVRYFI